jgi:hypothetical protein
MRHVATLGLLTLAAYLLYRAFRSVDPAEVEAAIRSLSPAEVAVAAAATIGSYLVLSLLDWFALQHFDKRLPYPTVLLTSFITYTFNFNFGTLVGAVAMRHRLYEKWGLSTGDVARVMIYATSSSFVGFGLVAGLTFMTEAMPMPEGALLPFATFRPLGVIVFLLAVGYLLLCHRRSAPIKIGRWRYELPDLHGAGRQIAVACVEWMGFTCVLYPLLPATQIAFLTVLGVHLAAAMMGALLHVPGGLGVLEGTFLVMLGGILPRGEILGSLIAYRFVYHLLPLVLASTAYLAVEAQTWSRGRQTAQEGA